MSREIGRTLPTTPWKRPTSTPLPETCTWSHDGSGRPSRAVSVRSQVPTTGGGADSCAESDEVRRQVAAMTKPRRVMGELSLRDRRPGSDGLQGSFDWNSTTDAGRAVFSPAYAPTLRDPR